MRAFLSTVVFFLLVNGITISNAFAQQKDTLMTAPVDTLADRFIPRDSLISKFKKQKKDTTFVVQSKEDKKSKKWSRPKKTMVMAMLVPGLGQIYNQKYWKLPILYAGAGTLAYFWITNQQLYSEFKNQYKTENANLKADPTYQFIYYSPNTFLYYSSVSQLASDRDTYRRYRDLSVAGAVALYAISILDAYVDAHLRTFDLSPDLSVSAKPLFYQNNATFVTGVSLNFNFKSNRIRYNQLLKRDF